MATAPTQIRIDPDVKKQATDLFRNLGLDMSSAVNMFLHQCILRGGLPFAVEMPRYSQQTLDAMEEARRISRDPDVKVYTSMEELKAALEE
ncbi:MAG: type II toxin-antitoxin system RelB/DinJ family antitoxin [Lachnospiraceae bacterium]|nr:type II toxin-antitoxin system RelB/DinJ family antitoxin [Lachnospiraceae bacterium]